jgi:hypothetical protein
MFTEPMPSNIKQDTHTDTRKVGEQQRNCWRWCFFSGRPKVISGGQLRTVVSSQSQYTETQELEDLITKPLPNSGCLSTFSDCTILAFRHNGIYMFIWYCKGRLFWLLYSDFQELRGYTNTWTYRHTDSRVIS